MSPSQRVAARYLQSVQGFPQVTRLDIFLDRFYTRNPRFKKYQSKVEAVDVDSGSGSLLAKLHHNEIQLFPKFWKLPFAYASEADAIFAHEMGKWALNKFGIGRVVHLGKELGIDVLDTSRLPFSQRNMPDAFADCFASYLSNPKTVSQTWPAWATLVEEVYRAT